jgi:hypothetical protein
LEQKILHGVDEIMGTALVACRAPRGATRSQAEMFPIAHSPDAEAAEDTRSLTAIRRTTAPLLRCDPVKVQASDSRARPHLVNQTTSSSRHRQRHS